MIVLFILILLLCIGTGRQDDCYIGKDQCNAIKGISILLVFCGHIMQYITPSGYVYDSIGDKILIPILNFMGQLVVVMFLFYSGYGVQESIRRKGIDYVKQMPKRRLLATLLNFDVAVFSFLLLDLALGINYKTSSFILAFTGWESIGNSNWYIFVILILYFMHYLSAILCNRFGVAKRRITLGGILFLPYCCSLY